jgi:hypothetical protein
LNAAIARFLFEPRRELGFRDLQRDIAVQLRIAGFPNFAHAALAQLRQKLVALAEFIARFE